MRAVKVNRKRWQMGGVVDGEEVIGWRAGGAARISQSKQFGKQCNSKEPAMQLQVAYLHSVPQKYAEGNDFPPLRDNENKLNNRRGTQTHKYTSKQRHESKTVGVPYAFLFLAA